jgi:hypothetical protein
MSKKRPHRHSLKHVAVKPAFDRRAAPCAQADILTLSLKIPVHSANVMLSAAEAWRRDAVETCSRKDCLRLRSFRFVMYLGSKIGVVKLMK